MLSMIESRLNSFFMLDIHKDVTAEFGVTKIATAPPPPPHLPQPQLHQVVDSKFGVLFYLQCGFKNILYVLLEFLIMPGENYS